MELIRHRDGRYVARTVYKERHSAKEKGLHWDAKEKFWYAPTLDVAFNARDMAASELKAEIEREYQQRVDAISSSRATDSDMIIPAPDGMKYMPFQKAGIEFMVSKDAVLNGDEMGCLSGDTIVDIHWFEDGEWLFDSKSLRKVYSFFKVLKEVSIKLYTHSLINGELVLNEIKDVKDSGTKSVIKVKTFSNGRELTMTPDHEVLKMSSHYSPSGGQWVEAGELRVGDMIMTDDSCFVSHKITSIQPAGIEHVYDIVMADPGRNFVANGIIVHNCGKTIQSIGTINSIESIKTVLVICPASLRLNWKKELTKWLTRSFDITVIEPKATFPYNPEIVIINYDLLQKYARELRALEWDMLIVDEAHYLKNHKTRRTQQVIGKKLRYSRGVYEIEPIRARRKVLMTGTPIINNPSEVWPLLSYLDQTSWGTFDAFTKRYCGAKRGKFGWDVSGSRHLDELQGRLRQSVMIRRLKSEVLKDLPPKLRQVIELPQNGAAQVVADENAAYAEHAEMIRELRVATELAKVSYDQKSYEDAVKRLRSSIRIAFWDLAKARKETAIAKVPYIIAHLENISEPKVVIFCHHKDVVRPIAEALGEECVVLTGETSMADRDDAVERFQNDPSVKYFVGSIKAAGVGLTLTAASHVIFAELDWTPASVAQAEDRLHRHGQQNSVLVQHLVFSDSVDSKIANTLIVKQAMIDQALDNQLDFPVFPDDGDPASAVLTYDNIEDDALSITSETADAIMSVAKYFITMSESHKVNQYDWEIVNNLSQKTKLTAKEAVLVRTILLKYDIIPKEMKSFIMD